MAIDWGTFAAVWAALFIMFIVGYLGGLHYGKLEGFDDGYAAGWTDGAQSVEEFGAHVEGLESFEDVPAYDPAVGTEHPATYLERDPLTNRIREIDRATAERNAGIGGEL